MLEPILPFREPVVIEPSVLRMVCERACHGYEARHKRESFGFVFGTLARTGRLLVRRAVPYRGGTRTRTGVSFDNWDSVLRVLRRREQLARELGMRFLGGFHSHVEIAGKVFHGFSASDRRSLRRDPHAALEVVTSVWAGGKLPARASDRAVSLFQEETGYSYRVRVYAKRRPGIRQVKVRVKDRPSLLILGPAC